MTIAIELGWWLAPAALTVLLLIPPALMTRGMGDDSCGIGMMFAFATYVIFWLVPSLIAWLVWALLR